MVNNVYLLRNNQWKGVVLVRFNERSTTTYLFLCRQNEAEMLLKCGQARECIKIIGRALVLDSHNAFLHYLRGEAFLSLENYSSAIKSIAKALRIEPFSRKFQVKSNEIFNI